MRKQLETLHIDNDLINKDHGSFSCYASENWRTFLKSNFRDNASARLFHDGCRIHGLCRYPPFPHAGDMLGTPIATSSTGSV